MAYFRSAIYENDSASKDIYRIKRPLGVNHDELRAIYDACPQLERLGFDACDPTIGLELIKIFNRFNERKEGSRLETLIYHNLREGERCLLWQMSEGTILISYQYGSTTPEVREMYEGTTLLWTRQRPLEHRVEFEEWEFPA
ncbi:MAG: hypothetical protein Q9213_006752 [Squamulea squamosa]